MIAPPSDPRYQHFKKQEAKQTRPPTSHLGLFQPSISEENINNFRPRTTGETSRSRSCSHMPAIPPVPHFSDPYYMQHLSTLAAMAWSDCAQAGEKLRRIYEQTTSFATPEGRPLVDGRAQYGTSSELYNMFSNPAPLQLASNAVGQEFELWSKCACVRCQATMQDQRHAALQRNFTSNTMTARETSRDLTRSSKQAYDYMIGQVKAKSLKRKPYEVTYLGPAAKRSAIGSHSVHAATFKPSYPLSLLPNPHGSASDFMANTKLQFDSSAKSHDLVVTPSLENHCYVSAYPVKGSVHTASLDLNSFNSLFPTRLPGTIK